MLPEAMRTNKLPVLALDCINFCCLCCYYWLWMCNQHPARLGYAKGRLSSIHHGSSLPPSVVSLDFRHYSISEELIHALLSSELPLS